MLKMWNMGERNRCELTHAEILVCFLRELIHVAYVNLR